MTSRRLANVAKAVFTFLLALLVVALSSPASSASITPTYDQSTYRYDGTATFSYELDERAQDPASRCVLARSDSAGYLYDSSANLVATNTADDFANYGSEFLDDGARMVDQPLSVTASPDLVSLDPKILRQMPNRGWTQSQLQEAVQLGQRFPAPNKINPANEATRYVHPTTGQSMVVDNVTGQVIHVGGPGFQY